MAETHVLSALKRRYAQTLGLIRIGADGADADLAHLAAVIAMFNPDEDLSAIRAVRPYKADRERWHRSVLRILKAADRPLKAREVARLVMAAHGIDPGDRGRLVSISCGLQATLGRLEEQGFVEVVGKPRRWSASTGS
jgi:hypothetical protein